jgi:uncharacterized membrane protein (DUF2068 family)
MRGAPTIALLRRDVHSAEIMKPRERRMLRGIALFKLAKAALLIVLGVTALKLVNTDIVSGLENWVPQIGFGPASHYIGHAILKASELTPSKILDVGVGSFIYAALFLTEGLGLWFLKRWAEWMTIVITSSLVPVEVWEIIRRPHWAKFAVLVINLALVAYLVWLVRNKEEAAA